MGVIKWIGEHSNKVRAAVWSLLLLLVALGAFALTEFQLAAAGLALSNMLDLLVETNTVSKVRVGERITEGVDKIMSGTGDVR